MDVENRWLTGQNVDWKTGIAADGAPGRASPSSPVMRENQEFGKFSEGLKKRVLT
jgi:hypothetical protein